MANKLRPIIFALLLAALVSMAYSLNYMVYSDTEQTRFGDRIKFWHGDTLCGGPIRTNDFFAIMQDPVFCDFVIASGGDFWRGSGYSPHFLDDYVGIFDAPRLELPTRATQIRSLALEQGHYFVGGDSLNARVEVLPDRLKIWWSARGMPFDTLNFGEHYLPDSAVAFFDCAELHLFGTVGTTLIIGASGTVLFEDNLVYSSADAHGIAPAGHPEKLAVVAEQDVKIQNSWANGRENSHGRGNSSQNMDSSSIVLDGIFVSLGGSFTFEQQNDPDSGYVCIPCNCSRTGGGPGPDDRGYLYLFGTIMQRQRGYIHRSTCSSTGYLRSAHYDLDLKFWHLPVFDAVENELSPNAIAFGDIHAGEVAVDTLRMRNEFVPIKLDSIHVSAPFFAVATPDTFMWTQTIPLSFAPSAAGTFVDTLRFFNAYYDRWFAIPVSGVALAPSGVSDDAALPPTCFGLNAYPNPFNAQAQIVYSLPQAGNVSLEIYDLNGRCVATLIRGNAEKGEHRATFDGSNLATGLYFAHLKTGRMHTTQKLLLVK
jgi:hypothetical protein